MKKYLMTGIAALAIGAAFVSCSKDVEQLSQEELQQYEVQKIKANYEQAFIRTFGQPASNQDWGFGSGTRTRSVNVNGNEWESRPEVTAAEAAAVYAWVNRPKNQIPTESYYEESPINLQNFFVTQVWGGQSTDVNCNYKDLNNNAVFGPEKMNHLQISKSADRLGDGVTATGITDANPQGNAINGNWDHANNFNASQNRDWDGNTMFVNWGTKNFAYHNSYDSKYHDKWIIVDGAYITDSEGKNHAGKYYVCFDFISTNDQVKTNFKVEWITNTPNPNESHSQNFEYMGAYSLESAAAAGLTVNINGTDVVVGTEGYTWSINSYVEGNKVVLANEYYTDWIVRLVEAKPKADLRIIAEDLNAGEDDDDFDFNDVVIDVYYGDQGQAKAKILAAGGTLQLKVDGKEVHEEFSKANNNIDCAGKMINTNGTNSADANVRSKSLDGLTAPVITLSKEVKTPIQARDNIKIEVYKGGQWIELDAVIGKVASKVRVGTDYVWKDERSYVGDGFKAFVAGTASYDEWYQNNQ